LRKIFLVTLAVVLLIVLTATPCLAVKSEYVSLDYDGDGIADCQYMVAEKYNKTSWSITVVYFSFDWEYLGMELWTGYWGVMEDTFIPWTYSFPS